jgi:paraquat-inducible protein B
MRKVSPTLIGGFVVGAITLTVGALMLFSSGPLFRSSHRFVAYFDQSVSGLRTGAPVKFRGVEVGRVTGVFLDLGEREDHNDTSIPVTFELYDDLIHERGGSADLNDPEWITGVIELGMRAQLLTESIVTGRQYIGIDVFPGSEAVFRGGPHSPHPEVPTMPTAFAQIEQEARDFFSELQRIPLDSIGSSLASLLDGIDRLVNSDQVVQTIESLDETLQNTSSMMVRLEDVLMTVEGRIGPLTENLDTMRVESAATMREARMTMESLRVLIEPGAPISYELQQALREFAAAARSIQALVEYLERTPSAPVRGKDVSQETQ